jgi:hypothetical protein
LHMPSGHPRVHDFTRARTPTRMRALRPTRHHHLRGSSLPTRSACACCSHSGALADRHARELVFERCSRRLKAVSGPVDAQFLWQPSAHPRSGRQWPECARSRPSMPGPSRPRAPSLRQRAEQGRMDLGVPEYPLRDFHRRHCFGALLVRQRDNFIGLRVCRRVISAANISPGCAEQRVHQRGGLADLACILERAFGVRERCGALIGEKLLKLTQP